MPSVKRKLAKQLRKELEASRPRPWLEPRGRWVCVDCEVEVYRCPDPSCEEQGIWHHKTLYAPNCGEVPVRKCYAGIELDDAQVKFVEEKDEEDDDGRD